MSSTSHTPSKTTSSPSPSSATSSSNLLDKDLVYHLDIFIAFVFCLAILFRLPRGLCRLWKTCEWWDGHFLGYTRVRSQATYSKMRHNAVLAQEPSSSRRGGHRAAGEKGKGKGSTESDQSHTLLNHSAQRFNKNGETIQPSYPPHASSCPVFLRPLAELLSMSLVPPYSNFQLVVMTGYFSILFYAYTSRSNIFTDPKRVAWIAASQLPFVFAFGTKNNILAWFLGLCYQHFNYLHRFLGRLVIIAANVHAIDFLFKWSLDGTISKRFSNSVNIWGLVTLIFLDIIFIFSLPIWRMKAYNIFLASHFIGYVVAIPALYLHFPQVLPFLVALFVPYCMDYTFRLLKSRVVTVTIRPIPSLGATRIEIPTLNSGWRPGQHVRVRILSGAFGFFRRAESHPFSIATAPVTSKRYGSMVGERGLVLICRNTGKWTERLFNMASRRHYGNIEAGVQVKALIEGPYGGPGHVIYSSYSAVVMVVGGTGISFGLSVIQDLVQKDLQALSRVKAMQLIWMIPNPDALTPMLPLFTALITSCPNLSISVYYTRAHCPGLNRLDSIGSEKDRRHNGSSLPKIPKGVPITLQAGRPSRIELARAIEAGIADAVRIGGGISGTGSLQEDERGINGVLVGVCGPAGLGRDINEAVVSIDSARKIQVGGVEVFEETFGW